MGNRIGNLEKRDPDQATYHIVKGMIVSMTYTVVLFHWSD